ncbi:MAG: DEAD/DEAH box helicase family protein, partial [Patescibacteria group bacterium]
MQPRPYQVEALEALHNHICTKSTNPCVVIPTGGGKSALIAWAIQRWKQQAPWFRGIILAHRKELIEQNAAELYAFMPSSEIGVFSAGIGRRDYDASILFASIDSVYKKAGEFQPFDVIMVDEAHRIPPHGEGKYRTFIQGCKKFNPLLRVVGWTATPFRMGCGQICHRDHILNEICYEASVVSLIQDGYLCKLRSTV